MPKKNILKSDPQWYKDAVIYQLHVKTFFDNDTDGYGDFQGLTQKLDYLKSLGITAIWLLPFYPSPLRDDGYDIADYYDIHPQYGTLKDFKEFLREAHQRDIKVITELVINHTSDAHAWFQRARRAKPNSVERNFYVWSDTAEKYKDARIIFKDFESSNWSWDPVANAYYWHRFYAHQPDLNFDSPQVQKEILKVVDFWFGIGVDGLRLDAVPYLFEREGTNCENLPETYAFLRKLRKHGDAKFTNKMLLAEANQWPEDAVAYFGNDDQCHMAFHFPLMPRLYMGLQMEDRYPIIDILEQTPQIPAGCQWAIFLRNHDELTLEMVTDEERDYMYRAFAEDTRMKINLGIRRRLVPLLNNDRKKIELMNILLLSLPGSPIIYYGDEIGMGDNYYLGDRNGVRTPMQWSPDRNAGFSKTNPQQLYLPVIIDPQFHYETVNVETQEQNLSSLLWWMRRVIDKRKKYKAFSRGSIKFLYPDNPKVLSFIREYEGEVILVVINLSRFIQAVELNLSEYKGHVPEEVFSFNRFPRIKQSHYTFTLGPHGHYWLLLKKEEGAAPAAQLSKEKAADPLRVSRSWEKIFEAPCADRLAREILPAYLPKCPWFEGAAKVIGQVRIVGMFSLPCGQMGVRLIICEVKYTEGSSETYWLPLSFLPREKAVHFTRNVPQSVLTHVRVDNAPGVIFDAVYSREFLKYFLSLVARQKRVKQADSLIDGHMGRGLTKTQRPKEVPLSSETVREDQNSTGILFEGAYAFKFFRRMEVGVNPDPELSRFLTEGGRYVHTPRFLGTVEYRRGKRESAVLGMLQEYVRHEGNAWGFVTDQVKGYYEKILSHKYLSGKNMRMPASLLDIDPGAVPHVLQECVEPFFLEMVKLLGQRTAELHMAFSSAPASSDFAPEAFSTLYQRSVYQSMRGLMGRVLPRLKKNLSKLSAEDRKDAQLILKQEKAINDCLRQMVTTRFSAMKVRIHGDYHLGQVFYTGKDFIVVNFEGELARPLGERRLKRCVLRDVAAMLRSFHYAAYAALSLNVSFSPEDIKRLESWADRWSLYVGAVFLQAYVQAMGPSKLIPQERDKLEQLLEIFLMEKAIYELGHELDHRPEWVGIPLQGIKYILAHRKER